MFGLKKRPTHVLCKFSSPRSEGVFADMDSPSHIRKLDPKEPVPLEKKPNFSPRDFNALMRERQERGVKTALCGKQTHWDYNGQVDHPTLNVSNVCPVCAKLFLQERPEFS